MAKSAPAIPRTEKASHVRLLTTAIWYELRKNNPWFTPYTVVLTSPAH